jgi:hypothetical protein
MAFCGTETDLYDCDIAKLHLTCLYIMLGISSACCIIINEYVCTDVAFHSYTGTSVIQNDVNSN